MMTRIQGAPQQRNQTSRKGKKSWRKNVNISDVEEGLDQLRDETITGYSPCRPPLAARSLTDLVALLLRSLPERYLPWTYLAPKMCDKLTRNPTSH